MLYNRNVTVWTMQSNNLKSGNNCVNSTIVVKQMHTKSIESGTRACVCQVWNRPPQPNHKSFKTTSNSLRYVFIPNYFEMIELESWLKHQIASKQPQCIHTIFHVIIRREEFIENCVALCSLRFFLEPKLLNAFAPNVNELLRQNHAPFSVYLL